MITSNRYTRERARRAALRMAQRAARKALGDDAVCRRIGGQFVVLARSSRGALCSGVSVLLDRAIEIARAEVAS